MNAELKPCPFCGYVPEVVAFNDEPRIYGVECNCGISFTGDTREMVVDLWNLRHTPDDFLALRRRVQAAEEYINFLEEYWGIPERLNDLSPTKQARRKWQEARG